jgi:tetratricopeptide (TPR) repeat protein
MINSPANSRRIFWLCILLGVVTFAAYSPLLKSGFINFDDPDYITDNPHVLGGLQLDAVLWAFKTGHAGNWHPLTWISHMLDVQIFGLRATGHHLVNLAFHIFNSIFLLWLLNRMTRSFWASAFVAALFALHPAHVESVAWVSERKDVLSTLFLLLTLWGYSRYVERRFQTPQGPRPAAESGDPKTPAKHAEPLPLTAGKDAQVFYSLSLLFFALGLMSKPMLVTVPFLLLCIDFWPFGRIGKSGLMPQVEKPAPGQSNQETGIRGLLVEKLPFLGLSLASCVITFWTQKTQGAVAPKGLPSESRFANAVLSYGTYVRDMFWPSNLAVFYPHPATKHPALMDWISWHVGLAALVLAAISIFAVRWARTRPYMAFGWAWYLASLAPVIGLVQVGSQARADRYTYIPFIGLFIALTWAAADWARINTARVPVIVASAITTLCACTVLTYRQASVWQDSVSLFQHALAVTTDNATAHFNLGAALEARGEIDKAMDQYRQSIEIEPMADAYYNMGHALTSKGKWAEAEVQYEAALKLNPGYVLAQNNLGLVYHTTGRFDLAETHYYEAVRLNPDYAEGYYNLGKLSLDRGDFKKAEAEYLRALQIRPRYPQAEAGLGLALAAQGRPEDALPFLRKTALVLSNSASAQMAVANVLIDAGRDAEAGNYLRAALVMDPQLPQKRLAEADALMSQSLTMPAMAKLTEAIRLDPRNADVQERMGLLLAQQGKTAEALTNFLQAVHLRPSPQAYYYVALAYSALKRYDQAVSHYNNALALKPDWPEAMNDLAWILATSPISSVRNGPEAVRLALKACQTAHDSEPRFNGTLDAAYAESGRFEEAIAAAIKTRSLAESAGQASLAEAAGQRLDLYRQNQPYRQP